jgi:putative phosphoribosyl transferase
VRSKEPNRSPSTPTGGRSPSPGQRFTDRRDAGRRLASGPLHLRAQQRPIVLGIARGGVAVAAEVARGLGAPLDVIVVRKIGAPMNPEYGIGALAEGGVRVLSERSVRALRIDARTLARINEHAEGQLSQRVLRYRSHGAAMALSGRTVILIDDGLATGHTARAAARSIRARGAARVILAVPLAAPASLRELDGELDEIVCVLSPPGLRSIAEHYEDFGAIGDQQVGALLAEFNSR